MLLQAFISGALLGLTSVPHCAAMCGPLAAFACSRSTRRDAPLRYQAGRTASYALAGALSGHLGRTLHAFAPSALAFASFALLAALSCLWMARTLLVPRRDDAGLVQLREKPRAQARSPLATLARLAPQDAAALGLLSALLPCGVLGAALLLAVASGDARLGASTLAGFATSSGLALFVAGLLGRFVPVRAPAPVRRWAALALIVAAPLLLARPSMALFRHDARGAQPAAAPHCH